MYKITILTHEILETITSELLKGNKLQIEYNKRDKEIKILKLNIKRIKVEDNE